MRVRLIQRFFPDTNMSCQHRGLQELASVYGINLGQLRAGEFVLFVNTAKTKLKLYGSHDVILYVKAPLRGLIGVEFLRELPYHLGMDCPLTYDRVMRARLLKLLEKEKDKQ